ncbi:MAG: class I SAM-dependent methyltransferase [Anaerolineales bacterium]|nr:MAG: class I SAM-dependent methyltransferase [Anaerolineales bacterium]
MLLTLLTVLICLSVLALFLHVLVRIMRHFYKFPMPEFAANIIDNPLRRKFQPPAGMPRRHGVKEGMTVLEIGPGNGTYTLATAREVGDSGQVITIDIEPKMIARVKERINAGATKNIEARVANVFDLPFEDNKFDLIYMIAVIGEIPTPERAMKEFHRVLKTGGSLGFSEILMDPDYPLAKTLINLAELAGFQLKNQGGNFFTYTLVFDKIDVLRE